MSSGFHIVVPKWVSQVVLSRFSQVGLKWAPSGNFQAGISKREFPSGSLVGLEWVSSGTPSGTPSGRGLQVGGSCPLM